MTLKDDLADTYRNSFNLSQNAAVEGEVSDLIGTTIPIINDSSYLGEDGEKLNTKSGSGAPRTPKEERLINLVADMPP